MKIARALQWREDAFELIEQGKDPVEQTAPTKSKEELKALLGVARQVLEEVERRLDP